MRNIVYISSYSGYPLSCSGKDQEGYYMEVLQAIDSLFSYMVQQHSSVFMTVFVVKFPSETPLQYQENGLMSRLIEALTLHYKRKGYDPKYLWAREISGTGQAHYHLMLLLNGNLIQNGYGVLNKATDLWGGCLGIKDGRGLVHLCKSFEYHERYGGVKIRRNDPQFHEVFGRCFQQASYLAKCYSKGGAPRYVNEFACSRLPPLPA